jgi:hypothetical protein
MTLTAAMGEGIKSVAVIATRRSTGGTRSNEPGRGGMNESSGTSGNSRELSHIGHEMRIVAANERPKSIRRTIRGFLVGESVFATCGVSGSKGVSIEDVVFANRKAVVSWKRIVRG